MIAMPRPSAAAMPLISPVSHPAYLKVQSRDSCTTTLTTKAAVRPALALAIDVFVRGDTVSEADFRAAYGEDTYRALCSLGLLRRDNAAPGRLASPVWVYQVDGSLIASDRLEDAEAIRHLLLHTRRASAYQRGKFSPNRGIQGRGSG